MIICYHMLFTQVDTVTKTITPVWEYRKSTSLSDQGKVINTFTGTETQLQAFLKAQIS